MPRFVILEHTAAPDDPTGLHYDLLLEQGDHCRTWRLAGLPQPDSPEVRAFEAAPHRLAWLDHEAGEVSGGRGFARRVDAGSYRPESPASNTPAAVEVTLQGESFAGRLLLRPDVDHWLARLTSLPSAGVEGMPEPAARTAAMSPTNTCSS
jgi:hypothetical protein